MRPRTDAAAPARTFHASVGTLARCATAFGVAEVRCVSVSTLARLACTLTCVLAAQVLLVGERTFNTFGAHGADNHVTFRHFPSLADVRLHSRVPARCAIAAADAKHVCSCRCART